MANAFELESRDGLLCFSWGKECSPWNGITYSPERGSLDYLWAPTPEGPFRLIRDGFLDSKESQQVFKDWDEARTTLLAVLLRKKLGGLNEAQ